MNESLERRAFDDWLGLIAIASVILGFGYCIHLENQAYRESQRIPLEQQVETYKPKLYTVITREATYENLKRAGSGEYEAPDGKRISFHEPYTEIEVTE